MALRAAPKNVNLPSRRRSSKVCDWLLKPDAEPWRFATKETKEDTKEDSLRFASKRLLVHCVAWTWNHDQPLREQHTISRYSLPICNQRLATPPPPHAHTPYFIAVLTLFRVVNSMSGGYMKLIYDVLLQKNAGKNMPQSAIQGTVSWVCLRCKNVCCRERAVI